MSTTTAPATSNATTATTNPLALDLNLLISQFADFTAFSPAPSNPWNDMSGTAATFVMADSEYRLRKPTTETSDLALTSDFRESYVQYFNELRGAIVDNDDLTRDQQTQLLASIDAAQTELDAASSVPALTVDASFDHIRNNQQDDHCAVELQVIWLASLNTWLPISFSAGFTWATETLAVPDQLIKLLKLPSKGPALGYFIKYIPVYRDIAKVLKCIALALSAWNLFIEKLNERADDGGRLYFPAAVLQGLVRILTSITPAAPPLATGTMPAPDLDAIGQTWQANYDTLSVLSRNTYRSDQYAFTQTVPYQVTLDATYRTYLPDLAWLPGGTGSIVTCKIAVESTNGFAVVVLSFDNARVLQMIAAVAQVKNNIIIPGPVSFRNDATISNETMINNFLNYFYSEQVMIDLDLDIYNSRDDARDANLLGAMIQVADSYGNHLRSISQSLSNTGLPQLPVLNGLSNQKYDFGYNPFVAVAPSDRAVETHYNTPDKLFSNVLQLSTSVSTTSYGGEYQKGQDPTLAVLTDGTTVLEVHGGNGNNNLYYNVGTLKSDGTLTFPSNGTQYDSGEDPCLAVANKDGTERIFEFHRSPTGGSSNLYYNIATRNGQSITWTSNGKYYADGVTPFATFAPDQDSLLATHEEGSKVKVKVGNCKDTDIDWISSYTVMDGTDPAIAVTSDNRVVLIARDPTGTLIYSLGQFFISGSNRAIRWTVVDVRLYTGQAPCLARMSGGKVLLAYENFASPVEMMGSILTVNTPDGFYH